MNKEIINLSIDQAKRGGLKPSNLLAFIEVETGGRGFDPITNKILIQFEPLWMKRLAPYTPSGLWSVNKVDVQSKEWIAFNDAFKKDKEGAMKATSIGLGQIMGFHYAKLGFKTVGEMWEYSKESLSNQIELIVRFILLNKTLLKAINEEDWDTVASIYNGKEYEKMAKKWGREPYDISLKNANEKYLSYNK